MSIEKSERTNPYLKLSAADAPQNTFFIIEKERGG